MKLVLFGDLHLDTVFASVGNATAARARRQALRETLIEIIKLAQAERADALLCSGDLYDHDRVSDDTGEFLRKAFAELGPMPVFIAPGNHDYLAGESIYRRKDWSDNVHIFEGDLSDGYFELEPGFLLWGAAHRVPANTHNFFEDFSVPDGGDTHVALAHASEIGWIQQAFETHQPHAAFKAEDIERAGFSHALLGHIHTPRNERLYTYPGNPAPLTFGEAGDRGAVICSFDPSGALNRERRVVAKSRVETLTVDVGGSSTQQDIRSKIDGALVGQTGYLLVRLRGEIEPSVDLRPSDLQIQRSGITSIRFDMSEIDISYDVDLLRAEPSVRGQFVDDVMSDPGLDEDDRRRIVVTGLRALAGSKNLEVIV